MSLVMTTAVCHAEDTCVKCILLCVMQKAAVGCVFSHDNCCMSCRRHLCDVFFVTQQLCVTQNVAVGCVLNHDNSCVSCRMLLWDVS